MRTPVFPIGGAAMIDPVAIERNIAQYIGMLTLDLDDKERSIVERWIAEAKESLDCGRNRNDRPAELAV